MKAKAAAVRRGIDLCHAWRGRQRRTAEDDAREDDSRAEAAPGSVPVDGLAAFQAHCGIYGSSSSPTNTTSTPSPDALAGGLHDKLRSLSAARHIAGGPRHARKEGEQRTSDVLHEGGGGSK